MRVVVTGASGNVGTALLRALREADDVDAVTGIVRRAPSAVPPAPYDVARWVAADVGGEGRAGVVDALAAAMSGADAVVHLAWAIQPNHDRDRLRRTNVEGTSRVLAAARAAGVAHVVVASSVGAYAPAHDDVPRTEDWPTTGVPTSEYSVDKADVEAVLDAHELSHPEVLITRLRPSLIFQRAAGSQMFRYFLGRWMPGVVFAGSLPALPWPTGMRLQVVHADDVAQAYVAALRSRRPGAFNIAAPGVLRAGDIAQVVAGGRVQDLPVPAARAAVSAAWNARALPMSPGWLDMGASAPVISAERARSELGWEPRHTALDTLEDVVAGMRSGVGAPSPPLRPR